MYALGYALSDVPGDVSLRYNATSFANNKFDRPHVLSPFVMPTLSADAWYLICQKLHLPDRLRFSSTHRYAREILGNYQTQRTQYWNSIFKSYEWVEAFKLQHLTPVLVFPEKEGSYIYLFMVKRKNVISDKCHVSQDDDDTTPEQLTEARISLFKTIRKSLRSYAPGENPWEMQFENFTLNMSSILLPGAPNRS
ncbi:uncharacterized protein FOBCDRAFT_204666 [Fusarium oxysporum Fo47]|uniref:uncharacterized protein n=1 Tax=Fusarium oxysporum Fo47 TaxID=660027 RepID=UPI002869BA09|nr:uncharacterized protein FOBCDRAFT_204666 [Fusarium oxysporum Fo47]WJG35908.1 hypothetical protein FOBCDRAFT_204666 [Fusarium oxysporum Fo47]